MIKGQEDYVTPKIGFLLKYKGEVDVKKMHNSIKSWFANNKYDMAEKEYKEKSGAAGKEFNLIVSGERKIDDYVSFNINVHTLIISAKKTENKYNGNTQVRISSYVKLDRQTKMQSNPLKLFLFFFYNNFIIKDKIQNVYEDKLFSEVSELMSLIKSYLKMN